MVDATLPSPHKLYCLTDWLRDDLLISLNDPPVCILTKQLQTLNTALSTMPEIKQSTMRIISAQDSSTSCAKCCRQRVNRFFLSSTRPSRIASDPSIVDSIYIGDCRLDFRKLLQHRAKKGGKVLGYSASSLSCAGVSHSVPLRTRRAQE